MPHHHPRTDYSSYIGRKCHCLTVIGLDVPQSGRTRLICQCKCGNQTKVFPYQFDTGDIKSCGCLRHRHPYNATHILSKTKLYHIWETMRLRCTSPKNKKYYLYGARGIGVCDEWLNDFLSFREWSLSHGYSEGLSLDRIDNSKGYSPDNCRWTTRKVQQRNRRCNRLITYNGETLTLVEWCDKLGLSYKTIDNRLLKGWDEIKALTTPIISNKKK